MTIKIKILKQKIKAKVYKNPRHTPSHTVYLISFLKF